MLTLMQFSFHLLPLVLQFVAQNCLTVHALHDRRVGRLFINWHYFCISLFFSVNHEQSSVLFYLFMFLYKKNGLLILLNLDNGMFRNYPSMSEVNVVRTHIPFCKIWPQAFYFIFHFFINCCWSALTKIDSFFFFI